MDLKLLIIIISLISIAISAKENNKSGIISRTKNKTKVETIGTEKLENKSESFTNATESKLTATKDPMGLRQASDQIFAKPYNEVALNFCSDKRTLRLDPTIKNTGLYDIDSTTMLFSYNSAFFCVVDGINNNTDLPIVQQAVNSEQKKFVYPKYSDLTTNIVINKSKRNEMFVFNEYAFYAKEINKGKEILRFVSFNQIWFQCPQPLPIDAQIDTIALKGYYVWLFRGQYYWDLYNIVNVSFDSFRFDRAKHNFNWDKELPNNLDASFTDAQSIIYFFKGDKKGFFSSHILMRELSIKYSNHQKTFLVHNFPLISTRNFPEDLDSAVVLKDVVHLFKGWKFTTFNGGLENEKLVFNYIFTDFFKFPKEKYFQEFGFKSFDDLINLYASQLEDGIAIASTSSNASISPTSQYSGETSSEDNLWSASEAPGSSWTLYVIIGVIASLFIAIITIGLIVTLIKNKKSEQKNSNNIDKNQNPIVSEKTSSRYTTYRKHVRKEDFFGPVPSNKDEKANKVVLTLFIAKSIDSSVMPEIRNKSKLATSKNVDNQNTANTKNTSLKKVPLNAKPTIITTKKTKN